MTQEKQETIKFFTAMALLVVGCTLYFLSMYIPPMGVIDSSVLGASGELFAVAGGLWGISAYTMIKIHEIDNHVKRRKDEED